MSNSVLFQLKEWYTLEDAAARLTATFKDTYSVSDVADLVVNDHLKIYWLLQPSYACKAFQACRLFDEESGLDVYPFSPQPRGSEYFEISSGVETLEGPMRVPLEINLHIKNVLVAELAGGFEELFTRHGCLLRSADGQLWQLQQVAQHPSESGYFPSAIRPKLSQLGFTRQTLEDFESEHHEEKEPTETKRRTDLTIIAALKDLILNPPDSKPMSFSSQNKLITTLEEHYKMDHRGITERTLQRRFAEANKIIKS